jgi:hypothetical protein
MNTESERQVSPLLTINRYVLRSSPSHTSPPSAVSFLSEGAWFKLPHLHVFNVLQPVQFTQKCRV